jgi:hypothetical protein
MMDTTRRTHRFEIFTLAVAAAATAAIVVACSASEPPAGEEAASAASADASADGALGDGSRITRHDASASEDDGGAGDECMATADAGTCAACCSDAHPTATHVQTTALLACACKAERCMSTCADSVCANPQKPAEGGSACMTCIMAQASPDAGAGDAGAGCLQDVQKACLADTECAALIQCQSACFGGK